jgi:phospholipid-binding lipoprotein MlaA
MVVVIDKPTQRAKIISAVFLLVMLSFSITALPCSAQPSPSLRSETILILWRAPAASLFATLDSSPVLQNDVDTIADPHNPVNHDSLQPSGPSPSSSPDETDTVLWQAPQLAVVSDPGPSSELSDSAISPREESSDTGDEEAVANESIADPLEPVNRAFFHFNDKLYFWVLKPVATGYKAVFSQELRVCFRNFFSNVATPVRVGNCLLQGQFKGAGNEAARFGINTTLGFFGFFDQGKDKFEIDKQDRDFGQTLGIWGLGPAFYINWPILGPSSLRDTAGFVGDYFLDPQTYLLTQPVSIGVSSFKTVNETSLRIGEYEAVKKAALDPYVSLRDGYYQYRENKIKKK